MKTFNVCIFVGQVVAESEEEANTEALDLLDSLAGSNDGSEVLANADPILTVVGE